MAAMVDYSGADSTQTGGALRTTSTCSSAIRRLLRLIGPASFERPVKKHEKLAKTLEWLNKELKPILEGTDSLELTYAYKNDHFDARC